MSSKNCLKFIVFDITHFQHERSRAFKLVRLKVDFLICKHSDVINHRFLEFWIEVRCFELLQNSDQVYNLKNVFFDLWLFYRKELFHKFVENNAPIRLIEKIKYLDNLLLAVSLKVVLQMSRKYAPESLILSLLHVFAQIYEKKRIFGRPEVARFS